MASYRSALVLAAATAVGCSAPVVDDVADASGAITEGVVSVERTVAGDAVAHTNVSAKFMRLSAPVDVDLAARVVGSKLELPAVGTCRGVSLPSSAAVRSALGTIELLDVGDVTLRSGAARMPLAVRAFPDVGDLVSGMFYTSRDVASDLPAGATYTLEGTGSGPIDRFSVDAEAPPALEDVRVAGTPLLDGVTLDEGSPVTLQWRAASHAATDVVFADIGTASGASFRCTFRDDGRGELPGWVVRPSTLTLSVHRVRERAFVSQGIDAGEVRFDLSVLGRVTVSPFTLGETTKAVTLGETLKPTAQPLAPSP